MSGDAELQVSPPKVGLWLLAIITFSGTLAMHIFVPALPFAAQDLGASNSAMQMTVSVYIFGLAVGQLAYGPLSDHFGRRPVLMVGLAIYMIAGLASALAPNVNFLIVARLFQALGGCAGFVLGRAIVRDISMPQEAAKRLALMNLMVTAAPGLAPLVGSLLSSTLGWRSILFALFGLGLTNFLFTWRILPETAKLVNTNVSTLARNYGQLLRSPSFLGYAIGGGCATTSMYAFIAAAPFIFVQQLARPDFEVGIYLTVLVSGVWLGSVVATRLISRVSLNHIIVGSNLVSVVATFVLLGAVLAGHLSVWIAVGSMFVFTLGVGIAAPAALARAVSINPRVIGSASSLYGFSQMTVGALCTALAGVGDDPALAASIVLMGSGVIAQSAFWMASRGRDVSRAT